MKNNLRPNGTLFLGKKTIVKLNARNTSSNSGEAGMNFRDDKPTTGTTNQTLGTTDMDPTTIIASIILSF
ncbi:hypothetical protein TH53_09130 [Pedobacter lusitanus]|uniref:Contig34, whole genome shotgun sequence n=1 Tax=Pedobacter lusitanus TaxID=1503925 RepID=A0A0D0F750_9SPHI|nr:hypothetical protein [Pedobacter lusitanus]KIO77433.1 hypothetical protein TH53_09130 [Pedobacter lusitanus]